MGMRSSTSAHGARGGAPAAAAAAAAGTTQDQQQQMPDATALVQHALDWVRYADAAAAAQRDAALERLCRRRAECTADALRGAAARLRAKLKAAKADAEAMRKAATAGAVAAVERASAKEEAVRAHADLAAAREALRAARAENGRLGRQRAAAAAAAAAIAASGSGAAAAAAGSTTQSLAGLDLGALLAGAVAGGSGSAAGADDAAGMERLTGVLALLQRELAAQQSAREGLELKLKESKSSIDRKNVLIGSSGRAVSSSPAGSPATPRQCWRSVRRRQRRAASSSAPALPARRRRCGSAGQRCRTPRPRWRRLQAAGAAAATAPGMSWRGS
ncbi:hypothetical protein COO60DRAFT_183997 [Scenedesmus sp. NREL 46B-D3]|nr:hypothetical protein COO60DRAFT_183997 [Scenedesmus sp. NREL 46B-D3]